MPPPAPGATTSRDEFPFEAPAGVFGPRPTNEAWDRDGEASELPPKTRSSGAATPPRRSVQFAREEVVSTSPSRARHSGGEEQAYVQQTQEKQGRQSSFLGKLKAFTTPANNTATHSRSASNTTGIAEAMSPSEPVLGLQAERGEPYFPLSTGISEAGAEADVEADTDDDQVMEARNRRKRLKIRRPQPDQTESTPTTPMAQRFASFIDRHHLAGTASNQDDGGRAGRRRSTMSDDGDDAHRAGVSEDEGRDRIRTAWRRGIEGARGLSYAHRRTHTTEGGQQEHTPDGQHRRPHALRRITGLGYSSNNYDGPPSGLARYNYSSANRWQQVKAGIKAIGQRKRDEKMRVDYQKSAQLMAEVMSGAPAALILASMLQRDEHGHRRIPVLLEQLKIRITDVLRKEDDKGDKHLVFVIDLEYGNGPARMTWQIRRTWRDFAALHARYKTQAQKDRFAAKASRGAAQVYVRAKMPKFPRTAVPYLRSSKGLMTGFKDEDFVAVAEEGETSGGDGNANGNQRPALRPRGQTRRSSFTLQRRTSSGLNGPADGTTVRPTREAKRDAQTELQRKDLEVYLQSMIRWLIFRPDSTRLCKFLELSTLAMRLSAEGGYQGKQGLLRIISRTNNHDLRKKPLKIMEFQERTKRYWFMIRHSYIVCIDGPESLLPHDVFLVDSDFRVGKKRLTYAEKKPLKEQTASEMAKSAKDSAAAKTKRHYDIRLYNSERKLKLHANNDRLYNQFMDSLQHMVDNTPWSKKQRFGSFAPVRENVWARWLVDGRDHMWQVSRAMDNAKDFIYIHDWWLSPELYMRRPAAISHKWRLDRLLKKKAEEGVKIFVIVYRNIESAIPIDSEYTKWSLLDLHPNICVQRSPNQFRQNQFFWAHHEKLVVVDNMMAFVGGVDLCFGRWDDSCHSLTDDKLTGFELDGPSERTVETCQVWPGKDYSNPRVQDFYNLDRPYEEMYDRTKVPRMPWHDIAMQIVGQPARDVGRHFVQRWNYVLRQRVPTRPTPVLLPPPEFDQGELEKLGMTGTCEVQILRSCSPWSIGTPNKVEHSIMNAYCALIEQSEHFVYIENQFYISSCTVEGTTIHNKIGDALVERAIRAHESDEDWHACLVIPLMPGFQNSVDSQDGTSVRLIMQCQYRSICRGEGSIFQRLRARGIEPEDHIRFYSLRQWGKIGPRKCLTTEQLYIHAKCMVVDDRSVIIGSANINERSMLGSRDSEVASIVRDTRMIDSVMGGQPYMVGEFPHTLRKRLMREHLGIDVDAIYRREQEEMERQMQDREMERMFGEENAGLDHFGTPPDSPVLKLSRSNMEARTASPESVQTAKQTREWVESGRASVDHQNQDEHERKRKNAEDRRELDVEGYGFDNMKELVDHGDDGLRDTYIDVDGLERFTLKNAPDFKRVPPSELSQHQKRRPRAESSLEQRDVEKSSPRPPWPTERFDTYTLGLAPRSQLPELPTTDDTDIGGPSLIRALSKPASAAAVHPLLNSLKRPEISEDCMRDPIAAVFYDDVWNRIAENNTRLYRMVFRCMPDSEVLDWRTYEKYNEYNERFMQSQGLGPSKPRRSGDAPDKSGPPGSGGADLVSVVAERATGGRERSKSLFSAIGGKLRPNSPTSGNAATAGPVGNEKMAELEKEKEGVSPDPSSLSVSGGATAVATPESRAADAEKEEEQEGSGNHPPLAGNERNGIAAVDMADEKVVPVSPQAGPFGKVSTSNETPSEGIERRRTIQYSDDVASRHGPETTAIQSGRTGDIGLQHNSSQKRRRRGTTKSSGRQSLGVPEEVLDKQQAESLLNLVQGHLVQWPYDWLEKEEKSGNWLYNIDQIAPLEIYD